MRRNRQEFIYRFGFTVWKTGGEVMELPADYMKNGVAFKQRDLAVADEEVSYGICVGLSAEWVARHKKYKSEGSAKRIAFIKSQAPSAIARQKAYLSVLTQSRSSAFSGQTTELDAALAFAESGMSANLADSTRFMRAAADECLHPLYTHTGGHNNYFLILLSFGKDNHCIAAYHSSGKLFGYGSHLYVFEPNFGEIKIPASETAVKGFFKALAEAYRTYAGKDNVVDPKILDRVTVVRLSETFAAPTRARAQAITGKAA